MATTTLQLYWDLASFEPSVRQNAAKSLITSLSNFQKSHEDTLEDAVNETADTEEKLDQLCASDVSYAVRRLLRGLPSSRQGARQGFSLALTELLAIVDLITTKLVLDLLFQYTEYTGSMKGDEIRDMLFGRLFGIMSIVAAGMIAKSSTTTDDIIRIIESLHEMSAKKSYLAEVCHHVIINLLPHLKGSEHEAQAIEKIKELYFNGPIANVDQLNLVLGLQQLENVDLSEQLSNWKSKTILDPANLPHLANILKEIPIETQEALADWKPQLHSVWDPILEVYFQENQPKNIASFQEFWTVAVDHTLFDKNSSHGRKYWGFQLLEKVLCRLSPDQMPLVFTANFMRSFINNLSSDDRFLNRAARHTAHVIQTVAEGNKQVGFALIAQLLGKHGHQNFDRITRTKTVENLLTTMDTEGIKSYLEYLAKTFVQCDEQSSESNRDWALNQMTLLVTNTKIPKEEQCINELVGFFLIHSYFEIKTGDKSKTYLTGIIKPTPALSKETIKLTKERFQSILVALSKLSPIKETAEGVTNKARKLNGFTLEGELWAYKVFEVYQSLLKNKKLVSTVKSHERTQKATEKAVTIVNELRSKIAKMEKAQTHDSVERGFEILFVNVILHTLIDESDGVSTLVELTDCYEKTFDAPQKKGPPAKKSKKAKNDDQENTAEEEQLDPIDVIVDILVSFLTSDSIVLKNLAEHVFEIFSHKLTKQSLEMLLNILASGEDKQDDVFGNEEEDDSEDDDVEMIDMNDSEEIESADEDEEVDEELRQKIEEAMKAQGINAVDDSDEELLDDDAMAKFDEKLAEVFKQKKILKEEKITVQQNVVHFKNNVMGLVTIYARKNPTNPLVLDLIVPLLNVVRATPAKSVTNQFVEKIVAFLKNRLPKQTEYPKEQGDYVFEILQSVHEFAKHTTIKDHAEMCNQLSLYLHKVILGGADFEVTTKTPPAKTKKALERFLTVYSESSKLYLTKKSTPFSPNIVQSLLQRYPLSSWHLLDTFVLYLNRAECANIYRLSMACKWSAQIIQRTVGKKSEEYNNKFLTLVPKIVESVNATINLSVKNEEKSLDYEGMKNYLRYIAVIVRLHKKVAPETVDLKKVWDTELIMSVLNNPLFSKPAIVSSCKSLQQLWS